MKTTEKFVIDNSPTIMTTVGVAGTVTTAVLASRASVKAYKILEVNDLKVTTMDLRTNKAKAKEALNLTWKCYIPPVVVGGITVTSIIMANRVGTKRAAAVAAAYTISEKAFEDYREKVVETLGEHKDEEIRAEVARDHIRDTPPPSSLVVTGNKVLCYDGFSGRYFESTIEDIKKAQNDLNYRILGDVYASLNDFYSLLGLSGTSSGEELGWRSPEKLELEFSTIMSDDQRPCVCIQFHTKPIRNYYRFD